MKNLGDPRSLRFHIDIIPTTTHPIITITDRRIIGIPSALPIDKLQIQQTVAGLMTTSESRFAGPSEAAGCGTGSFLLSRGLDVVSGGGAVGAVPGE